MRNTIEGNFNLGLEEGMNCVDWWVKWVFSWFGMDTGGFEGDLTDKTRLINRRSERDGGRGCSAPCLCLCFSIPPSPKVMNHPSIEQQIKRFCSTPRLLGCESFGGGGKGTFLCRNRNCRWRNELEGSAPEQLVRLAGAVCQSGCCCCWWINWGKLRLKTRYNLNNLFAVNDDERNSRKWQTDRVRVIEEEEKVNYWKSFDK